MALEDPPQQVINEEDLPGWAGKGDRGLLRGTGTGGLPVFGWIGLGRGPPCGIKGADGGTGWLVGLNRHLPPGLISILTAGNSGY